MNRKSIAQHVIFGTGAMTGSGALAANALLDMIAEYYRAEGRVRTLAWLVLSAVHAVFGVRGQG